MGDLHQQASLTTGTIAYNDKLSTDFRHLVGLGMKMCKRATGSRYKLESCWIRGVAGGGRWNNGFKLVVLKSKVARRGKSSSC
jgi:hypothetical protein